jgi:hypothetical protein
VRTKARFLGKPPLRVPVLHAKRAGDDDTDRAGDTGNGRVEEGTQVNLGWGRDTRLLPLAPHPALGTLAAATTPVARYGMLLPKPPLQQQQQQQQQHQQQQHQQAHSAAFVSVPIKGTDSFQWPSAASTPALAAPVTTTYPSLPHCMEQYQQQEQKDLQGGEHDEEDDNNDDEEEGDFMDIDDVSFADIPYVPLAEGADSSVEASEADEDQEHQLDNQQGPTRSSHRWEQQPQQQKPPQQQQPVLPPPPPPPPSPQSHLLSPPPCRRSTSQGESSSSNSAVKVRALPIPLCTEL